MEWAIWRRWTGVLILHSSLGCQRRRYSGLVHHSLTFNNRNFIIIFLVSENKITMLLALSRRFAEITKRCSSKYNIFAQKAAEELNKKASNANTFDNTPNHVFAGRGYREELYSARRFTVKKDLSIALKRMQRQLNQDRILQRCKERRFFTEPFEERNEVTYKGRRRRFDALVRKTINDIREIHLSRHYDELTQQQ